jgi:carbon-monoxide dehydrogenase large subunit
MLRVEDERFLTGRGRFVDNIAPPDALVAYFVRSPVANGRIRKLDTAKAQAVRGVAAVLTGADLAASGIGPLPCIANVTSSNGTAGVEPRRTALAETCVRHVGDPVALIVADRLATCLDAAEQVGLDIESLPSITDLKTAAGDNAPTIWPEAPGNIAFDWETGDRAGVEAALASAAHVIELEVVNNRIAISPIEPRALVASWIPELEAFSLLTCSQGVHEHRRVLSRIFDMPDEPIHVQTPDVGGGFGIKAMVYPEQVACMAAARRLGRPVRWQSGRIEAFLSDNHGRDHVDRVRLALDADGRITALAVDTLANLGAYLSTIAPMMPTMVFSNIMGGSYAIPAVHVRSRGVFTNMVPVDAYRGAGVPESLYLLERAIDVAAQRLGIDRAELRRRNLVPARAMPYTSAVGRVYDVGDFHQTFDAALTHADWAGLPVRRAASDARGRRRGIGVACYLHCTGGYTHDSALVRVEDDGGVLVISGAMSTGQGHETVFRQLIAERLEIEPERIRVVEGDSALLPNSAGSGGSSSMMVAARTIVGAADTMLDQARELAARKLECGTADLVYGQGGFTVAGTDVRAELGELVRWARQQADLPSGTREDPVCGLHLFDGDASTFPYGTHVCEVEVDPETGAVSVEAFTSVDDLGRVVNPMIVDGQLHGGLAQGIGQALHERVVHDPASGQLLTGSFMDYAMPRADELPAFRLDQRPIPSTNNPLGMKGVGEVGPIGAPPAVINAVCDALGIEHIDMPATPERVWSALRTGAR